MDKIILETKNLHKTYQEDGLSTKVLNGISFSLKEQEKIAIVGSSGSGKSTLLHLMAGLDSPSTGEVILMGNNLSKMSEVKRGKLRNIHLGFVYQFHFLLPELSSVENVMMPLRIRRDSWKTSKDKAESILTKVGLQNRFQHKPSELSGGERQRVAIARALITEPKCILADEPTGNLDDKSSDEVFDLMLSLNNDFNSAFIIVTHDMNLANKLDCKLLLNEGNLSKP